MPLNTAMDVERLRQPSYTPPRRELGALFDLYLASDDEEHQQVIAAALRRAPADAFRCGLARLPETVRPGRARLVRLLGRLAVELATGPEGAAVAAELLALLGDPDPHAARQAIVAAGKLPEKLAPLVEPVLLDRFALAQDPADRRALGEALGKLGGPAALAALQKKLPAKGAPPQPPGLAQTLERAVLRLERSIGRRDGSAPAASSFASLLRTDRALPAAYTVVLRCRAGLTAIVAAELRAKRLVASVPHTVEPEALTAPGKSGQPGRVSFPWSRPLSDLFAARTWSSLAFALPCPASANSEAAVGEAVAAALADAKTRKLLGALGADANAMRYRLHFLDGGHRRALTWRIAAAVRERTPELINDPKESPWQVEIRDRSPGLHRIELELVPRKLTDPRFAYRRCDVPAASHPPLAAALCRLAEIGPEDVVWDPFVGSGSELIEIALSSPCKRLFGTDLDGEALACARVNAAAAQVSSLELHQADALAFTPPSRRVTRIVTNPPMGRRTRTAFGQLSKFLTAFLERAAATLAPGGRLVWISPQPRRSAEHGRACGLKLLSACPVDLNGFWGTLEVWEKR